MKLKWSISWYYRKVVERSAAIFALILLTCLLAAARFSSNPERAMLSVEAATDSLLCVAYRLEGIPYRYGGKNESGFDCSGYTRYLYQQIGVDLNASAAEQYKQGLEVHADSLQAGDLLFFRNTNGRIFHVGLYVGEREERPSFIHASSSRGVVVDDLRQNYFHKRLAGARRIFNP